MVTEAEDTSRSFSGSHPGPDDVVPRRGSRRLRTLGRAILKLLRWRIAGTLPNRPKFLVIAAPHTSNWDFVIGIAATLSLDVDAHWFGKHTLFRPPLGTVMLRLGGIPVDRRAPSGLVEQIVKRFRESDRFVLGLAPEGTRREVKRWKTGFYRIASGAGVPIVCAYFDYDARVVGIGPEISPSGDYESDLKRIRDFYASIRGVSGRRRLLPAL